MGICVSTSAFPRLGCPGFTVPEKKPEPETSFTRSLFWPSEATFLGHPRFARLSENIRKRRGEKVAINIPIFLPLRYIPHMTSPWQLQTPSVPCFRRSLRDV